MKKSGRLRELLKQDGMIVAPGGFSPLAGMIAQKMGFQCVYMSGYGVAAYKLGYPDVGLMTMTEALDNARAMAGAVNIPLIADVDTGYGNALNVRRTVREFENAGVAAIQMEDQCWPKRCGHMEGKQLIPAEEMCGKIEAAAESRQDDDFVIIARTDANTVLGFDEAVQRCKMYRNAGADVIFFESPVSLEQVEKIPTLIDAPLMINMSEGGKTPILTNERLEKLGYKIAIWPSSATWAAAKAIEDIYREIMEKGTTREALDKMIVFHDFNELIGLPEAINWVKRYV